MELEINREKEFKKNFKKVCVLVFGLSNIFIKTLIVYLGFNKVILPYFNLELIPYWHIFVVLSTLPILFRRDKTRKSDVIHKSSAKKVIGYTIAYLIVLWIFWLVL